MSCTAQAKAGFKSAKGADLTGTASFKFNTGGPFVQSIQPYSGNRIDEEQFFTLRLNGAATLASLATVLRGGGIPNLEIIQTEVNNLLTGNADQIREFLNKLDTFTAELNKQRDDITRAIESTNKLFTYWASRNTTIDRLFVDLPPLMNYLAGAKDRVSEAVIALGRFSKVTGDSLGAAQGDLRTNLELLQRELTVAESMSAKGLMSEVEVMRLRRQVNDLNLQTQERINRFRQDAAAELVRIGIPLTEMLNVVGLLRANVERAAEAMVQLIDKHLLDKYGDGLPPPEESAEIGDLIWRLRPLVEMAVHAEVSRAMQRAASQHLGDRLSHVLEQFERSRQPSLRNALDDEA